MWSWLMPQTAKRMEYLGLPSSVEAGATLCCTTLLRPGCAPKAAGRAGSRPATLKDWRIDRRSRNWLSIRKKKLHRGAIWTTVAGAVPGGVFDGLQIQQCAAGDRSRDVCCLGGSRFRQTRRLSAVTD